MSKEQYGLLVEWKQQAPILMEGERTDYGSVYEAYQRMLQQPSVIRLCIVKLIYAAGNESLCPPERADRAERKDGASCAF